MPGKTSYQVKPTAESQKLPKTKVVFTTAQIDKRVGELAAKISRDYAGKALVCLTILRGGFFFASDLIRRLKNVEVELEFVKLASYAGTRSSGRIDFRGQLPSVSGREVLVIEDLVDTGRTLASLDEALKAQGPRSLRYAICVDKKARREVPFECEYVAFDLERDSFLVGYGMDNDGKQRTLPDIREIV
ncbi:MAG: hypoxanthine phosphoribosyltransferase [Planctomycetes bacterium]|nr:hypoxanthine phosphoribosyltransferase [Planctomycetota bacterium]